MPWVNSGWFYKLFWKKGTLHKLVFVYTHNYFNTFLFVASRTGAELSISEKNVKYWTRDKSRYQRIVINVKNCVCYCTDWISLVVPRLPLNQYGCPEQLHTGRYYRNIHVFKTVRTSFSTATSLSDYKQVNISTAIPF